MLQSTEVLKRMMVTYQQDTVVSLKGGKGWDNLSIKLIKRKIINYKPIGGKQIHESVSIIDKETGRGRDLAYKRMPTIK